MMKKHIIPILIALLCFSCNSSQRRKRFSDTEVKSMHLDSTGFITPNTDSLVTVDLNPFLKKGKEYNFGSLVKSTKYVPLETTNKSLLARIRFVLVTDSHIYIQDALKSGGVVIFDREGKFIKRLPYGRGPGELNAYLRIAYDKENDELVVAQRSYLMFYTSSGKYLRQKKIPFIHHELIITPDGYVFKNITDQTNFHIDKFAYCTFLITDKDFKLEKAGLVRKIGIYAFNADHYISKNYTNDEVYITQEYADTIYHYSQQTHELTAAYKLDFKDKKLPDTKVYGVSFDVFREASLNNDYYSFCGNYLETNTKNLFMLANSYLNSILYVYRDKKSGHLAGGHQATSEVSEIPTIAFPSATFGNSFISICRITKDAPFIKTSKLLSHEDKLKLEHLTSDDNPVLVFWEMKDF